MKLYSNRFLKLMIVLVALFDVFLIAGRAWSSYGHYAMVMRSPGICPLLAKAHSLDETKRLVDQTQAFARGGGRHRPRERARDAHGSP